MFSFSNYRIHNCPALLRKGFRIFFFGAVLYSIVSILFWMLFYTFGWNMFITMPISLWHGHEMVYGYTMAVVAGFLLTAVSNWTGRETLTGTPLLILFSLWVVGRIFAFIPGEIFSRLMLLIDNVFLLFLLISITSPVIKKKQWKQFAVLSKIILILFCSIFFYFLLSENSIIGMRMVLKFAVYMLISLILTIAKRVVPFFVEKGVGYAQKPVNSRWIDISSLVLMIAFSILDVFWSGLKIIPVMTICLAIIHGIRIKDWYTPKIWTRPLLWILFIGYSFIIIGFVFKTLSFISPVLTDAALHSFTYGGIGTMTLGMMARVSLGHTGRNIHQVPFWMPTSFVVLTIGAIFRVFVPIFNDVGYQYWIGISQLFWMVAFILFAISYFPMLCSTRADGKFG